MPMDQGGEAAEIEKNKRSSRRISRIKFWFDMGITGMLALLVSLAFYQGEMLTEELLLFNVVDYLRGNDNVYSAFNPTIYFSVIAFMGFIWLLLIAKPSKYLGNGNGENLTSEKGVWATIVKIIYLPFNLIFFTYKDVHKFNFKPGWFYFLDKELFEQTHEIVDEYERVRNLNYLSRIFEIYSKDEKTRLLQLFKSKDSLMDLYKITEGYLIQKDNAKFDEFTSLNLNNFENFRAFNGRDKVEFSIDYIILKTKQESKNFENFLRTKMFKNRSRMSRENNENLQLFLEDISAAKKLVGFNNIDFQNLSPKVIAKLEKKVSKVQAIIDSRDYIKIHDLIIEAMMLYFKLVMTRLMLNRYTYIASGIYVSKIADYTTRMIIESYDSKVLVNIAKGKNDGTSKSFESDTLANLFLYSYNVFVYQRRSKVLDDINRNLNTDIDDIVADVEVESFKTATNISE